jgi:SAM-dependent MidA family methyltransferase
MSEQLSEIVKGKIGDEGPISFRDFMEIALYYPELGYFTAPFLTNLYGSVIAKQLEEMWLLTGKKDFAIVEYGAGSGSLCSDILIHLRDNKPLYKNLKYYIIEKSESLRKEQKNILDKGNVYWIDSIEDISPFTGCVLANEVLDNFSVHKVSMKKNQLNEIFVAHNNGFKEVLKPAQDHLKDYFRQLNIELPNDYSSEINLQAIEWLKKISASLVKGFVITIDYGFPSSEMYKSYRNLGTIVCYYKHSVNDQPYRNIGEQDITAHVNFSALEHWGSKNGLLNCGFTTQSQFLAGLGLAEHIRKLELKEKNDFDFRKKFMVLHTLLQSMGRKFKVLIQQKGLQSPRLSGLQFCQPLI